MAFVGVSSRSRPARVAGGLVTQDAQLVARLRQHRFQGSRRARALQVGDSPERPDGALADLTLRVFLDDAQQLGDGRVGMADQADRLGGVQAHPFGLLRRERFRQGRHRFLRRCADLAQGEGGAAADLGVGVLQGGRQLGQRIDGNGADVHQRGRGQPPRVRVAFAQRLPQDRHRNDGRVAADVAQRQGGAADHLDVGIGEQRPQHLHGIGILGADEVAGRGQQFLADDGIVFAAKLRHQRGQRGPGLGLQLVQGPGRVAAHRGVGIGEQASQRFDDRPGRVRSQPAQRPGGVLPNAGAGVLHSPQQRGDGEPIVRFQLGEGAGGAAAQALVLAGVIENVAQGRQRRGGVGTDLAEGDRGRILDTQVPVAQRLHEPRHGGHRGGPELAEGERGAAPPPHIGAAQLRLPLRGGSVKETGLGASNVRKCNNGGQCRESEQARSHEAASGEDR